MKTKIQALILPLKRLNFIFYLITVYIPLQPLKAQRKFDKCLKHKENLTNAGNTEKI